MLSEGDQAVATEFAWDGITWVNVDLSVQSLLYTPGDEDGDALSQLSWQVVPIMMSSTSQNTNPGRF